METVSVRDLRDNLSQIIEESAIAKKHFLVTKFDKPKVVIIPLEYLNYETSLSTQPTSYRDLPGFGMWKKREDLENSAQWVRRIRDRQSHRLKT